MRSLVLALAAAWMLAAPMASAQPAPPTKLDDAALAAAIPQEVSRLAGEGAFDGAFLVARRGKVIVAGASGLADREAGAPNTLETRFRFGSMGKLFTAVAAMQLVQAGKLELDAPVGRYLPDYPNAEVARTVTVAHLLSHTGGVGDIFGPEFAAHRGTLREPSDYVALYGARAPAFPPGSRADYSNYGFVLLGRIVEAASGERYDAYLSRHIFGPARMRDTGNRPETASPRRALAYAGPPGALHAAANTLPYRGTPAGGGYSTVSDFLRFSEALADQRLLDAAHLQQLIDGKVAGPGGAAFPFDFAGRTRSGRVWVGHGGGAPGMNGAFWLFPDRGWVVVVLANRDPPAAKAVSDFIVPRLP